MAPVIPGLSLTSRGIAGMFRFQRLHSARELEVDSGQPMRNRLIFKYLAPMGDQLVSKDTHWLIWEQGAR